MPLSLHAPHNHQTVFKPILLFSSPLTHLFLTHLHFQHTTTTTCEPSPPASPCATPNLPAKAWLEPTPPLLLHVMGGLDKLLCQINA